MNGAPGQGDWIAPAIALGAAGLAGAGRTGSPASNLGLALLPPIIGAYAERGITSEERARKQALEDFLRQRMERRDIQEQSSALGNLYLQSGLYEPVAEGEPAQIQLDIGGRKVGLRQRDRPDVNYAIAAYGQALGPEFERAARGAGFKGSPEEQMRQLAALATAWPAGEQRQARERWLTTVEGLAKPGLAERGILPGDLGESWTTAGRTTVEPVPPRLTPEVAAILRGTGEGVIPPAAIDNLLRAVRPQKSIAEQVQEFQRATGQQPAPPPTIPPAIGVPLPPAQGPAAPTGAAPAGRFGYSLQQTAEGEPRVGVTYQPPTSEETATARARESRMGMAKRLLADPSYTVGMDVKSQKQWRAVLEDAVNTGSEASLGSAIGLLGPGPKQTMADKEVSFFTENPEMFKRFMEGRVEGKETPADLGRRLDRYLEMLTLAGDHEYNPDGTIRTKNPRRAKVEAQIALVWKRLGEKFPDEYGMDSIKNRAIYEHWSDARALTERAAFLKRHKMKDIGE